MKKIVIILLFLITFSQVQVVAQKVSFQEGSVTLKQAFEKLEAVSSYKIAYNNSQLDLTRKVMMNQKNQEVIDVLSLLLKGTGYTYKTDGNYLIIVKNAAHTPAEQKQKRRRVTGQVNDSQGEPIIGANVKVEGASLGTITDLDGCFAIDAPESDKLMISYMGFSPTTVPIGGKQSVLVVLKEDKKMLDELVVVGYGTQRKSLVTNAISTFKPGEDNMRQVLSPSELLQGRVAGVTVSSGSGTLGSAQRVSIRGVGSLSASNEPLYVIDGIPIISGNANINNFGEDLSALAVLNLSDIESMEVLKDAASAAIYGSRGTNGVIIITTKSGKEGKSDIRVNVTTGISQFANRNKIKYANSDLYIRQYNAGVDNYNHQYGLSMGDSKYKIPLYGNPYAGMADTDWLGLIIQDGLAVNADVSFSGGSQKTKFYTGISYTSQEGVIRTNSINKLNLKSKISHEMNSWLEVGANMSGNMLHDKQIPGANLGSTIIARAVEQRPFDRPFKPNGDYYLGGTDELTRHNPMQILNEQNVFLDNYRFLGNFYGLFKLWGNKLTFRTSANFDVGYTYDYQHYNEKHVYGAGGGRVYESSRLATNMVIDNVINYNDQRGDFTLGAMLGHSFQTTRSRAMMIDGTGFPSPAFDVNNVASVIQGASGSISEYAIESYFGRANIAYKERYILNATLRTDGSSRFAPATRYGWFPSASLGWTVSNEEFWNDNSYDLKFRLSYGKTGNQDGISNYSWRPLMGGGQNYDQESGIAVTGFGNTDLTWETADQYNVGFDFGLMNGKVNFLGDVYLKNTNNLLYSRPMHTTTGVSSILSNIGSMKNFGVEFAVNTHFDLGQVNWTSSLNFTYNSNELTQLIDNNLIPIGSNRALQVGQPIGAFYIFQMDGIYQYDGEVPQSMYDLGVRAGDVKWRDVDNNGIINDSDRVLTGCSTPDFYGGWNNSFKYKGFQLDLFLTYMLGNDVYSVWAINASNLGGNLAIQEKVAANYWTGPGSTNLYPRPMNGDSWNKRNSTRFLEDGSFIRLRNVTLSYTFPTAMLKPIHLKGLRLFAQADNLFLLTNYSGWDPEVSTNLDPQFFGMDNLGAPQPRSFNFGINITL